MNNFKIGDKVVYPNHGVGVIQEIESKTFGEAEGTFYSLRILANDSTVLVPTGNTEQVGLRPIITKRQIPKVYRVLQNGEIAITGDWKGRYQENCEKMRTGSIVDVATVFKNLTFLSQSKNLSYRERKMLDKAKYLIVSEIAEVQSLAETDVEAQVDEAVSKSLATQDH
ncbi:MAG: CarD family transcriptional regulator [Acidobacteriota bacterium]